MSLLPTVAAILRKHVTMERVHRPDVPERYDVMSRGPFAAASGNVYQAPDVQVIHDEARSWLRRCDRKFDVIQASMIDTWAATGTGAFALAENSLYTVEAFRDYYDHLTEEVRLSSPSGRRSRAMHPGDGLETP